MPDDSYIHTSCEAAYDGEAPGPACKHCLDRLGRMDSLSRRR